MTWPSAAVVCVLLVCVTALALVTLALRHSAAGLALRVSAVVAEGDARLAAVSRETTAAREAFESGLQALGARVEALEVAKREASLGLRR